MGCWHGHLEKDVAQHMRGGSPDEVTKYPECSQF